MASECVLFYQVVVMILGTLLVMAVRKIHILIPLADAVKLMCLGVVGMGCTDYLLNRSYECLPLSIAVMLHFMYPAIVLLIMFLVFRQKLSPFTLGAVLLSLVGLVLVSDTQGGINWKGALLALGSAVTYALFAVANDRGSVNRYPLMVKLFYMSLGTAVIYGGKTLLGGSFSLPADGKTGAVLAGVVGIGSLLAFYFITAGIKGIGAGRAAVLNMLEPMTGVVGGVLIYHEVLTKRAGIGCLCVLAAVLLIALDGVRGRAVRPRKGRCPAK